MRSADKGSVYRPVLRSQLYLFFPYFIYILYSPHLQLPGKLNELDNNGDLALDLALSRKLESIATTLVNNKADVDMVDQSGWSLLHKAIQRGRGCRTFSQPYVTYYMASGTLRYPQQHSPPYVNSMLG